MEHLAIMNKKLASISQIIKGKKTIESRWYKNRITPWNKINAGDIIFFKYSGEPVIAKATVKKILQFEKLNEKIFNEIVQKYSHQIKLKVKTYTEYYQNKNYCILIFLKDPIILRHQFNINKKGFGISSAWITVDSIDKIKIPLSYE